MHGGVIDIEFNLYHAFVGVYTVVIYIVIYIYRFLS